MAVLVTADCLPGRQESRLVPLAAAISSTIRTRVVSEMETERRSLEKERSLTTNWVESTKMTRRQAEDLQGPHPVQAADLVNLESAQKPRAQHHQHLKDGMAHRTVPVYLSPIFNGKRVDRAMDRYRRQRRTHCLRMTANWALRMVARHGLNALMLHYRQATTTVNPRPLLILFLLMEGQSGGSHRARARARCLLMTGDPVHCPAS